MFLFDACNRNESKSEEYDLQIGIFVINEGNFTFGNASLSFIDMQNDTIFNNIFYRANNLPLGDVAQSAVIYDEKLFVVVNNSGKIFVLNPNTIEYLATIDSLSSPRYILMVSGSKAYVSDLYSNFITVINPQTYNISGAFDVGCPIEMMLKYGNYVFAVNWNKGNKLLKIDANADAVIDCLTVAYQPNSLVLDQNQHLWVLSDGGYEKEHLAALTCINPDNMQIIKQLFFYDSLASPSHLCINQNKDTLYFINSSWANNISNGGIFRMSISDSLPQNPFIPENNKLFYSLYVADNQILVSDAVDYQQPGKIYIYSLKGSQTKTFTAGIIPGNFLRMK